MALRFARPYKACGNIVAGTCHSRRPCSVFLRGLVADLAGFHSGQAFFYLAVVFPSVKTNISINEIQDVYMRKAR